MKIERKLKKILPKSEDKISFSFKIPENASLKRTIIPIDIDYDNIRLGQFREAVLVIMEGAKKVL